MEFSTYFMIKPEGLKRNTEIKTQIEKAGFLIGHSKIIEATKDVILNVIYNNDPEWLRDLHVKYFVGKQVEIGLLSGKTLENFIAVTGKEADPAHCPEGTIRRLFGLKPTLIDGALYYRNSIHRPLDELELSSTAGSLMEILA